MFHILAPKKFRSAKQSIPSRKLSTTFRASSCSLPPYAPMQVPNRTSVPPSTSDTKRSCGNALRPRLACGRPNSSSLPATSATSRLLPSMLTVRHRRYHAPRVRDPATGPTSSSCKRFNGSYPSLVARAKPASPATCTFASGSSSHFSPSSKQRSTSRADDCMYSARATTKYTITWAGNARCRTLARPVARKTSSILSGGNVLAITPRLM